MTATSVPEQIGRYRILNEVGRGGMGVVYRVQRDDGLVLALKLMAPELAANAAFRERFTRESQLVIDHPNVVPIYDAGVDEGRLYMVMYLVEGIDLKRLIRTENRLLPSRALSIFKEAADALDAAHAEGLVHRDVKPQNFLLEPANDEAGARCEKLYLSDFGLVKRVAGQTSLTGSAHLVGTAQYMSPEQIRGRQLDGRTDVYALGCVLYECLTGSPPFSADEEVAVLWSHVNDPPPRPSEGVPVLPEAVDEVVAKAMAKEPEDRYLTAGDLVDDLEAVLDPGSAGARRGLWGSMELSRPRSAANTGPVPATPAPAARYGNVAGWAAAAVLAVVAAGLMLTRGGDIAMPVVEALPQLLAPDQEGESAAGAAGLDPAQAKKGRQEESGAKAEGRVGGASLVKRLRDDLPGTVPAGRERATAGGGTTTSSGAASSTGAEAPRVAAHPKSGSYVYMQSGHERICPGGGRGCLSGNALPDTQEVKVGQSGLSRTPVVVSAAGVSSSFAFGSTIRYGYSRAQLYDLQMSFDTDFGTFRVRLDPEPVLKWLAFPLSVGTRWAGTWNSDAPGRYEVEIVDEGTVAVARRNIEAVQVRTWLQWTGGHPGEMETVSWIARDTRAVLESAGHIRVATNIKDHDYDATFTTRLQRGPGYGG